MNETIKTILNRRSTRVFTEETVNEETLNQILEAGLYAPSAHNQQSWHFTVITNKDILDMLSEETKSANKNHEDKFINSVANNDKYHVFYNAPVGIIVSGSDSAMSTTVDCAAASENILLASESFELGACWIGFITLLFQGENAQKYKEKLNIPEGFTPLHGLVIGHKKVNNAKAPERREGTISFIK